MSLGNRALLGLAAGLAIGVAAAASAHPTALAIGSAVELVGSLWINAILMTIVPLVVSKLIVSVAGNADTGTLGRAGWRSGVLFVVLLTVSAVVTALVMPGLFARLPIDPSASASLRAGLSGGSATATSPTMTQWMLALIPTNPIRSAADGAMVPLVVFSVAFALGATRTPDALRLPLVGFFRAVDAAITVVLGWVVALSPYGVFALGLGLAMRVGVGIVGALGYYVLVSSIIVILFTLVLYVIVAAGAGISPILFARAAAPAQVVALSTHSSAASLPAMLEGAEVRLGLSQTATGFVLPLALAVFKYSSPVWFVVVTYFIGRLYDMPIDASRAVPIIFMAVVTSFAVGGVPSGAAVMVVPVLLAAGLPPEAMGLLLAVDPLPNAFRTVANVTGMLAVAALADGRRGVTSRADPV
jgi:Na+/H+-dicarboxylate symporter